MNSSPSSSSSWMAPFATGLIVGAASALVVVATTSKAKKSITSKDLENAGATVGGNDLSLFYDDNVQALTTVKESAKFLPKDLYQPMVQQTVICCVDILLVRTNRQTQQKETLVVQRAAEPAKGLWWLPGGRLLKGETFFDAARRKAWQETGLTEEQVRPVQVLGVWNTFFPRSSWDTDQAQGTQTVNPIVLVEMSNQSDVNIKLDQQSEEYRWIGLDPKDNSSEDKYVMQALLRLRAWDPFYIPYK